MAFTRIQKIAIAGACMFIYSILFLNIILPSIVKSSVRKQLALKKGWVMRDLWGKFPFSLDYEFCIFNVTNPEKIALGEKPILQEIGPYIYDEWPEKTNQIDHEEDDSVSYTAKSTYFFNSEKSNGLTGHEEVIVPNYFVLALINAILIEKPSAMPLMNKAVDSIFKKPESLFMKIKVKDILFDGFTIDCNVSDTAGAAVCNEVNAKYEDFRLKKLGGKMYSMSFWGPMNATDSKERLRVYRGLKDIMDVGRVIEYDNKPNISVWNDEYCDTFNGTDGTIFHPFFDKNGGDDIVVFNPGLCRSLSCSYDLTKAEYGGVELLRYTADLGTDPNNHPLHKCYCTMQEKCLPKGAYDLYKCVGGPLIMTNPHFYLADPYYISMVDGLKPEKEKHMIIIDFQPFAGAPLHAHTRAQINMFITKIPKFRLMKNFPDALLPLMWFDRVLNMPDYLVKQLKFGLKMNSFAKIFSYLLMFGGLGMCGYAGYHYKAEIISMFTDKQSTKETSVQKNDKPSIEMPMNISTIRSIKVPPSIDSN